VVRHDVASDILHGEPGEERGARDRVPVRLDLDLSVVGQRAAQHELEPVWRPAPEIDVVLVEATQRRHSDQGDSAGPQGAPDVHEGGVDISEEVQRLGEDHAIELVRGQRSGDVEIGVERRAWVPPQGVDHRHTRHLVATDRSCIQVALHLEDLAPDVAPAARDEVLDVDAIDRLAAVGPIPVAECLHAGDVDAPQAAIPVAGAGAEATQGEEQASPQHLSEPNGQVLPDETRRAAEGVVRHLLGMTRGRTAETRCTALFASHEAGLGGGATRALFELCEALHQDGRVEPIVVTPQSGALSDALDRAGVRNIVLPVPSWTPYVLAAPAGPLREMPRRVRALVRVVAALPSWRRALRHERPSVVVTSTATTPVAALACGLLRIPHVWWVQELVSAEHGLRYALGAPLSQRLISGLSAVVVTNSQSVARHFARAVHARKLRVVQLAVPGMQVGPNRIAAGSLRLLSLGRQSRGKGTELAVRALGALDAPDVEVSLRFVGVGSPEFIESVRGIADELGVGDQVEFTGFSSQPHEHFEWSNALLQCSDDEAFGRVTVEALAGGRPVIGSRSGGTLEIVAHEVDGLLYTPGDVGDLAAAIGRLAKDPSLLEAMAQQARARNTHRFSMEHEVDDFVEVLRTVSADG
jgi:glycosyltransferase involved in cell wall biosynthesis